MPVFNTLKSADALMAAGVPDAQARATVQVMADALESNVDRLATKDDLKMLGTELRGEMKLLASDLNRRMDKIEAELGHVKWMSGPVALVAVIWIAKEALKIFGVAG
jgi:hypothetical protein